MDKFGIFNILNALTGVLGANSPQTPTENGVKNLLQTPLSELFSSINSGAPLKNGDSTPPALPAAPLSPPSSPSQNAENTQKSLPPLSEKMLATMKNHQAIVTRVKEKQKNL